VGRQNYADASSGKQRQKEARLLLMLSTKCSQVAGLLDMRMPATCCGQSRHKSGVVNDTVAVLRGVACEESASCRSKIAAQMEGQAGAAVLLDG
jgi:hypothetical protein